MSSVGRCFDVGNATRVALGIWRGVFDEEEGEREGEGGKMERGQRAVDGALRHEVFSPPFLFVVGGETPYMTFSFQTPAPFFLWMNLDK